MKKKNKKTKKLTRQDIKEKTIVRMKKARKVDFIFLRKLIEGKLQYAKRQQILIEQALMKAKDSIVQNTATHQKVTGMIMVLEELLEEKTELEKELDKKGCK